MKLTTLFIVLLVPATFFGQGTNDFRSVRSGNWNDVATWERYDGASWIAATFMPASPSGIVTIRSGHTVTFTFDLNVDQIVVDPGGTLSIAAGRTMTLVNGAGTDLTINGTVNVYGTLRAGTGAIDGPTFVSSSSTLIFMNGGTYKHSCDAGLVPAAQWNQGSTADFVGPSNTDTAPAGLNQPFHHVIWEYSGRGNKALDGALSSITGDLTIKSVSGSILTLFSPGGGSYLSIGGNLVLSATLAAGSTVTPGAGTGGFARIDVGGGVQHVNGILDLTTASGATATMTRLYVGGPYQMTGGTLTVTGTGPAKIILNGSSPQTLSATGTLTNLNKIGLEVDNAMGVTMNTDFTVADTLQLTNGAIHTETHTLILGTSGSVLGKMVLGNGSVIGNFKRWISSTLSCWVFPMGTDWHNKPLTITFTSAPNPSGSLTASYKAIDPGATGLPLSDPPATIQNVSLDGYWTLAAGDLLGRFAPGVYSLDIEADGCTGISDYTTLHLVKRPSGGSWTVNGTHQTSTGSDSAPILHRTGMAGYGEYGIGADADNPLPVELVSFHGSCSNGTVQLLWRTATESNNYGFDVERMTKGIWTWTGFVLGSGTTSAPRSYSFAEPFPGGTASESEIRYRLVQIDRSGATHVSPEVSVAQHSDIALVELDENYPNPFGAAAYSGNSSTAISFRLREERRVTLTVFSMLGREVARLSDESLLPAGMHTYRFDGSSLPAGMYYCELAAGAVRMVRMMHLLK